MSFSALVGRTEWPNLGLVLHVDRPAGTSTAASLAWAAALAAVIRARSRLTNGTASTSLLPLLLLVENVIDLAGG